ncbi:hypothetical protein MHM95_07715 [Pseudoalteromonas sp. CnMc7-15]|uniref:hypothetical protein n=1 Tax=unclassified Pseudoalteromonas TaxID=194690 RepID=UPI001EF46591|nr:hypothetical protein [Pseudoalteromonas sp. CnMc7-15]MCG7566172.1 hypothetical protein [Pseudoalteromonas sp. CnMc7-15]
MKQIVQAFAIIVFFFASTNIHALEISDEKIIRASILENPSLDGCAYKGYSVLSVEYLLQEIGEGTIVVEARLEQGGYQSVFEKFVVGRRAMVHLRFNVDVCAQELRLSVIE